MDECIHGLGPVASCVICNGRAERERQEAAEIVARWTAKYPTRCRECSEDIDEGDPIARTADDRLLCEGCA